MSDRRSPDAAVWALQARHALHHGCSVVVLCLALQVFSSLDVMYMPYAVLYGSEAAPTLYGAPTVLHAWSSVALSPSLPRTGTVGAMKCFYTCISLAASRWL